MPMKPDVEKQLEQQIEKKTYPAELPLMSNFARPEPSKKVTVRPLMLEDESWFVPSVGMPPEDVAELEMPVSSAIVQG